MTFTISIDYISSCKSSTSTPIIYSLCITLIFRVKLQFSCSFVILVILLYAILYTNFDVIKDEQYSVHICVLRYAHSLKLSY